ncbi:hypothetical protein COCSUDRAFT_63428 [Coccomyxa subellipsoidea C-169]|uniref:Uncharacterized protein n=1 Tax=Coccomyxa subellipsoidea (strain C-169) TaxID=574566 RepID=I0YXC7_COCSC|nr:hypothetical protein COCSUDRAFT_63428 [Coccomyxa subellipsoidea C-169]EIE23046.1 hypothetical protein COCSUDRAFT_63428 [Coccomyxa subellipsoidea C-169]|eukprot:XP_005647590.1 hypothetical protein COCSUDRAFT_63428 [Coccomyxa subellipsoidea C-169]
MAEHRTDHKKETGQKVTLYLPKGGSQGYRKIPSGACKQRRPGQSLRRARLRSRKAAGSWRAAAGTCRGR